MANPGEISAVFAMLKAHYHNSMRDLTPKEISDLQMLWCELLRDIDGDTLKTAALQHVSESKWFPMVSELRDAAAEIVSPDRKTPVEAWGDVMRQIKRIGSYGIPKFDDDITADVVVDMGWQILCLSEDSTADRARFIQGYQDRSKRERRQAVQLPQVAEARARIKKLADSKKMPQLKGKS